MSEEKKEKLETAEKQNEQIENLGEVLLDENQGRCIIFSFCPLSERWKGMNVSLITAKPQSMSTFCQNWP